MDGTDIGGVIDYGTMEKRAGGVVSLVVAARTKQPIDGACDEIVIKHTLDYQEDCSHQESFGYRDHDSLLKPAPRTHQVDFAVLDLLQHAKNVNVPRILRYYPERRTTVMADFRADGFELMQDKVVDGSLPMSSAANVARAIASLMDEFRKNDGLVAAAEDRTLQARERLEELHMFLRPELPLYGEIERSFLSGRCVIPTDIHPKNLAIDVTGKILAFDFGRSIAADNQFPAPNFAAHIGLASICNCFEDAGFAIRYISEFVSAYDEASSPDNRIDELAFVRYFMSELLHRGLSGRWLDRRFFSRASLQEVERAVHDLAIETFRPERGAPLSTIDELLDELGRVSEVVAGTGYKGRRKAAS